MPRRTARTIYCRIPNEAREALRTFSVRNPWEKCPLPETAERIVDVGAHLGLSTLYWSMRYPQAQLDAVEMDAANAARCRELFAANGLNARVTHAAIAAGTGLMTYTRHASDSRHRLDDLGEKFEGLSGDSLTVDGMTLANVFDAIGVERVDILKVDIEGAEEFLLRSVGDWAPRVKFLLLELHHNIVYEEAVAALRAGGFEIVGEDRQDRVELWCRRA